MLRPRLSRRVFFVVLLTFLDALLGIAISPTPSAAFSGWSDPIELNSPAAGWLASGCNGGNSYTVGLYHTGRDYWGAVGTGVHAIGDGVVTGNDDFSQGFARAVFVKHRAADGVEFLALYGHVDSGIAVGSSVKTGDQLGTLASLTGVGPHLHFGLVPGTNRPSIGWGRLPCSSWPNTNGFADPVAFLNDHGGVSTVSPSLPDGQVVENLDTNPRHRYVAAGGRLFWYDRYSGSLDADFVAQMRARLGANAQVRPMYGEEIHPVEANYPSGATHRPVNNSFMYERGSTKQYMIQYDYAWPLGDSAEVEFLSGANKAVMVPAGSITPLMARPDAMPFIANNRALKALSIPEYYEVQGGMLYWLNNFTVLDCLVRYKGGAVQQVPASLINMFIAVGRRTGQIGHCSYPGNVAFHGPGGVERWYIGGDNPYTRALYNSPLSLRCWLGGSPPEMELSTAAINQPTQVSDRGCPNNTYLRDTWTKQVFQYWDGELHWVMSPDSLLCMTHGHPEVVIDVEEPVIGGLHQGLPAFCTYEGKMVQAPNGAVFWVKDGQRRYVGSYVLLNCIKVRANAGDPIPVPQGTVDTYANGASAYCPYGSDVRFVRGQGQPDVWRVFPDGTRQHAGSLCAGSAESPATDPRWRVYVVPAGEVDGHALRDPAVFWATPEACAAIQ